MALSCRIRQNRRADIGKLRLHNHPEHILIVVQVHPGLSSDGGIDLRKKRGGDIGVAYAAFIDRCGKARDVGGDSAADRHQQGLPGHAGFQHRPCNGEHCVHVFHLLRDLQRHRPENLCGPGRGSLSRRGNLIRRGSLSRRQRADKLAGIDTRRGIIDNKNLFAADKRRRPGHRLSGVYLANTVSHFSYTI